MTQKNNSRPAPDSGFPSGFLLGGILGAVLVWLFGTQSGQKQKAKLRTNGLTLLDDLERYLGSRCLPPQAKKELRQLKTAYQQLKSIPAKLNTVTAPSSGRPAVKPTTPTQKTHQKNSIIKRKFITHKKTS